MNEASLLHFFEQASEVFALAAPKRYDFFISLNGKGIKLSFANEEFRTILTQALGHLESAPVADPDLTVCLWDTASNGLSIPAIPWTREQCLPRGNIDKWQSQRFAATILWGSPALSFLDRKTKTALYWASDFRLIPYWERGAPLRSIFQWWAEGMGGTILHAGAVGRETGGVIFVGRAGAGKSTTTLSCMNSSLSYASDDYCLFLPQPVPRIFSLYTSAKVGWTTLEKLPHLGQVERTQEEKALLYFYPQKKEKLIPSFPLKALFVPRITGTDSVDIVPCSTGQALIALAPNTLFQLPIPGTNTLRTIAQFVSSVPCFQLNLGWDFAKNAQKIETFLC